MSSRVFISISIAICHFAARAEWRGLEQLPGSRYVTMDYRRSIERFVLAERPTSERIAEFISGGARIEHGMPASLGDACVHMLKTPSDEAQERINGEVRSVLDRDGKFPGQAVSSGDDRFEIIPTAYHRSKHWLAHFARGLFEQRLPVRLFLDTNLRLSPENRFVTSANLISDPGSGTAEMNLRIMDLYWPPTSVLEHEMFHNLQMQGFARGDPDVWPRHEIVADGARGFGGIAKKYFKSDTGFFIEEIGAFLRDVINAGYHGDPRDYVARWEGQSDQKNFLRDFRGFPADFAVPALAVYERALSKIRVQDEAAFKHDFGVRAHKASYWIEPGLFIAVSGTWAGVDRALVQRELERGHRWIEAYARFLANNALLKND